VTGRRVNVDADLLLSALADAIEWVTSLIHAQEGHPELNEGPLGLLARYRRQYQRVAGRPYDPFGGRLDGARSVPPHELPLHELPPAEHIRRSGDGED
jgi:hypothetical protein